MDRRSEIDWQVILIMGLVELSAVNMSRCQCTWNMPRIVDRRLIGKRYLIMGLVELSVVNMSRC